MTGSALGPQRVGVLLLAGGASWERDALGQLTEHGFAVLKRCVDVADLMASASVGAAGVAVVSAEVPGLDAEVVTHLLEYDVRSVAVCDDLAEADRMCRLGMVQVVAPDAALIAAAVEQTQRTDMVTDPRLSGRHLGSTTVAESAGEVIAVWGPTGAPGRTTLAIGLAAECAAAGRAVVLVDADPYGGAVAQQLGILDEVSGMLAAARHANAGTLDADSFARCCRLVGERLQVLTGLPRADRRVEVRAGVIDRILEHAAVLGDVVVDCGFCLEADHDGSGRDQMTLDTLLAADQIVVVGTAEPVGLTRLARGLVEVGELLGGAQVRVVVNRMRGSLGWSERDIRGMVEGYLRSVEVYFVPEDRDALDRAQVAGKSLPELGESRCGTAIAAVAAALFDAAAQVPNSR